MPGVTVRKVHAKTMLVNSRIPGVRYAVNPYRGCSHGCAYCYAVFMQRYHARSEGWGMYVDVKVNAPGVLERDIRGLGPTGKGPVILSSVCDPYLPEESEYRITRRLLAMLLNNGFPVSILTKSGLVTRDKDIMKGHRKVEAGLTITGLYENARRLLEPRASPHKVRIEALRELHEEGIYTWAFLGPVLPGLTDVGMVFRDLDGIVDYVLVDKLNLKKGTWERFEPFMSRNFPSLLPAYRNIHHGNQDFWDSLWPEIGRLARRHDVRVKVV